MTRREWHAAKAVFADYALGDAGCTAMGRAVSDMLGDRNRTTSQQKEALRKLAALLLEVDTAREHLDKLLTRCRECGSKSQVQHDLCSSCLLDEYRANLPLGAYVDKLPASLTKEPKEC